MWASYSVIFIICKWCRGIGIFLTFCITATSSKVSCIPYNLKYSVHQVYGSKNAHASSPGHGVQFGANGIFVHSLYGSVLLRGCGRLTSSVLKLGGPVSPCTLGVRFRKRACQFTRSWGTVWRKRHFCTPVVRFCTARWTRMAYKLCTQTGRVPYLLVHYQVYGSKNVHASSPGNGVQSGANSIFVHPLHGFVRLSGRGHRFLPIFHKKTFWRKSTFFFHESVSTLFSLQKSCMLH